MGDYITIEDLRDEDITEAELSDDRATVLITYWSKWIDLMTGQFFDGRSDTIYLDGDGSRLLQLPIPIIECTSLHMNDDFTNAIPSSYYAVYNSRGPVQDDRKNPRIKLKMAGTSIFSASSSGLFEIGDRNQKITGVFGFVEPGFVEGEEEGDPITYITPDPIKRAVKILVNITKDNLGDDAIDQLKVGRLVEEVTDRHRATYSDLYDRLGAWNPTGITEVDLVIQQYRRPMIVTAPRTMGLFRPSV